MQGTAKNKPSPTCFFLRKLTSVQTVVVFPGIGALLSRTFSPDLDPALGAILKSGRAVLFPIYKSTFERGDGMTMASAFSDQSSNYRDHVIMWVKDASRALTMRRRGLSWITIRSPIMGSVGAR